MSSAQSNAIAFLTGFPDRFIHILGSFSNIKIARSAIVRLLRGSPPGKVYSQMRAVASRAKDRF